MNKKFTTALADCAKHHVALPADELKRTAKNWECPYCRIAELEAQLDHALLVANQRLTYLQTHVWKSNKALGGDDE